MSAWEQWRRPAAAWHELLAPLPPQAEVHRGPLAGTEGLDAATLQPIDGWEQLSVNMTAEASGLRHVLIVLDGTGRPISVGDAVLYRSIVSAVEADGSPDLSPGEVVFFHENVGGRLEVDGSFRGTRWQAFCVQGEGEDLPIQSSTPVAPTQAEISALKELVAEVLRRAAISGN